MGVSQLHLKEQRPSWTFRHDEETSAVGWLHHSGGTVRPSFSVTAENVNAVSRCDAVADQRVRWVLLRCGINRALVAVRPRLG